MDSLKIVKQSTGQLRLAKMLAIFSLCSWLNFWVAVLTDLYQGHSGMEWYTPLRVAFVSLGLGLVLAFTSIILQLRNRIGWVMFILLLLTILIVVIFVSNFKLTF